VADHSATIIDLNAYRARKRTALERKHDERQEISSAAPLGFYFLWPVLAWMPVSLLLMPSATEDFS
jgi:hypothetical protein